MKETWKDIKGYEGRYQVSNLGRVKSLLGVNERILKQHKYPKKEYLKVELHKNGKQKTHSVHSLVAQAFLGRKGKSDRTLVIDHINNNGLDNRLENLQIITQRENISKEGNRISKYRGVFKLKDKELWRADIKVNSKQLYLGSFKSELRASTAFELALLQLNNLEKVLA